MFFQVFDFGHRLHYIGDSWPMARAALDYLISEADKSDCFPKACPSLIILPEYGYKDERLDEEAPND